MTPDETVDRMAMAAFGALDGDERAELDRALQERVGRRDLEAFEAVAAQLGLATDPVPPTAHVRERLLAATRPLPSKAPGRDRLLARLAAAAAVVFAVGFVVVRVERDEARRVAAAARAQAAAGLAETRRMQAELSAAREGLAQEAKFRALVGHQDALFVNLGPLPPAPRARARVVFNRATREAVLIASGLEPAGEGRAYEVWIIGKAAPVPAGVFQADASGHAVFRLSPVPPTADIRTFAVTLEPAGGVSSPTGPMVLAGAVS